jgi:hypothetical protein
MMPASSAVISALAVATASMRRSSAPTRAALYPSSTALPSPYEGIGRPSLPNLSGRHLVRPHLLSIMQSLQPFKYHRCLSESQVGTLVFSVTTRIRPWHS